MNRGIIVQRCFLVLYERTILLSLISKITEKVGVYLHYAQHNFANDKLLPEKNNWWISYAWISIWLHFTSSIAFTFSFSPSNSTQISFRRRKGSVKGGWYCATDHLGESSLLTLPSGIIWSDSNQFFSFSNCLPPSAAEYHPENADRWAYPHRWHLGD